MSETPPFQIYESGDTRSLRLESDRLDACLQFAREQGIDRLDLSSFHGFGETDVEFLRDHRHIRAISVLLVGALDLSGLRHLERLEELHIDGIARMPDFGELPHLRRLMVTCKGKLRLSEANGALRDLCLSSYSPKSKDLSELPTLPELEALSLNGGSVLSLEGIERFAGLKDVQLSRLPRLTSIVPVTRLTGLKELRFRDCKRIGNHATIVAAKALTWLGYINCGSMPSISFLNDMPALTHFSFAGTLVEDGNLEPLFRLKWAGFHNKPHYSHRYEDVIGRINPETHAYLLQLQASIRRGSRNERFAYRLFWFLEDCGFEFRGLTAPPGVEGRCFLGHDHVVRVTDDFVKDRRTLLFHPLGAEPTRLESDPEHPIELSELLARYAAKITEQDRAENEAHFAWAKPRDRSEELLLEQAKTLRLVLPHFLAGT
ncbi:MAG: hypothetical protein HUU28_10955 [Planctomycetaceae bacterium]|nr:hypothetical protein [Planctomycetaceae bacterium]